MNYQAYECINESIKNNNYLAIYYYDSVNYIYKQNNHIVVKDIEKEVFYNCDEFIFKCNKPIDSIVEFLRQIKSVLKPKFLNLFVIHRNFQKIIFTGEKK